ncbi:transmembrane protein 203-like [Oscarella lobularis]|uniref:transmembrane protein 203-like n=1 Tax=Oscarella lobularis TaxID=121494 RepID=UPI0033136B95
MRELNESLTPGRKMLFSYKELSLWFGMAPFEIWIDLMGLIVFSILLPMKIEDVITGSWWYVFLPLFAAIGLNAYFSLIVFVRVWTHNGKNRALVRILWNYMISGLILAFLLLLCFQLEQKIHTSYGAVMSPLFAAVVLLLIRGCQVNEART